MRAERDARRARARDRFARVAGFPAVRILLRGDAGFAHDDLMAWCESHGVDFLFGLAKNRRLVGQIEAELAEAAELSQRTGKPYCCAWATAWWADRPGRKP